MAGGQLIDRMYIETFENNVKHLAQQMGTKLRGTVMERGTNGNQHAWDILDFSDASDKSASAPPTPSLDLPWSRRVSIAETKHTGSVIDNEDIVQMLIEPKSAITENLSMSMNRAIDDIIIAAATANSIDGSGTSTPLDADQVLGDYSDPISFDFITAVQEKFMKADIDPSQPKYAVIGPTQVRKLLQLTEQSSMDFARPAGSGTALTQLNASGIVPNWLGFTWIMSNRLLSGNTGERDCLFYCPDALGLQVNEDITVQVAQDPSASFAWRIYSRLTMGACRVQDKKIVIGKLADTI
jgi:hypothetical protein